MSAVPSQGDRVVVTMLDSGHVSDEFVRAGGAYPSKCYVSAGLATVRVLTPFSESVWAKPRVRQRRPCVEDGDKP